MPLRWMRKRRFWKSDKQKQHRRTERTAGQCYQNRLLLKKSGDAQNDWETAEKIVRNPIRKLLFTTNCLWIKVRPSVTLSLFFSAVAVCFTWWLDHQAEVRQQTTSQNLNHQRILESYIGNIKEISLSRDYNNTDELIEERTFIMGMTLPVLRELTGDDARKAQLVLFLYQMQMCGILSDQICHAADTPEVPGSIEQTAPANVTEQNQQPTVDEQTQQPVTEEQDQQPIVDEQTQQDFLQTADLKFANFKGYKLPKITFRGADLRGTNLASADLREAVLVSANLSCHQRNTQKFWSWVPFLPQATEQVCANLQGTNLQNANLNGTVLNGAILLSTDLRQAQGLTQQQLNGDQPPLLCNAGLPAEFSSLQNRDCLTIVNKLHEQSHNEFPTFKQAQEFVEEQKAIDWE